MDNSPSKCFDGHHNTSMMPPSANERALRAALALTQRETEDSHDQINVAAYHRFQCRMDDLQKNIYDFAVATSQLGCSAGIIAAAYHLRCRLTHVLSLFRENAADVFPKDIYHSELQEGKTHELVQIPGGHRSKMHLLAQHPVDKPHTDREDFPTQMKSFGEDFVQFCSSLGEYPEFEDLAFTRAVLSLNDDIQYCSQCMNEFKDNFTAPPVQLFIHEVSVDISGKVEIINSYLRGFIEDVETVLRTQKRASEGLQSIGTIATFFSAVTATTLQYSFGSTNTTLTNAVNGFWFTSLVLSASSAVNSLLAATWKQSMYRSPAVRVPWWVLMWIKRTPLAFLVTSVICFSIGLILFAFSSKQHPVTLALTTACSMGSILGIAGVSAWVGLERWAFEQYRGTKWASIVLRETKIWTVTFIKGISWPKVKQLSGEVFAHIIGAAFGGPVWLLRSSQTFVRTTPMWVKERTSRFGNALLASIRPLWLNGADYLGRINDPEGSLPLAEPDRRMEEPDVTLEDPPSHVQVSKPVDDIYIPDSFYVLLDYLEVEYSSEHMQENSAKALAISYAEVFKLIEALKNLRECDVLADSQRPGIRGIRFSPNGSFLLVFGGIRARWWALYALDTTTQAWKQTELRYHTDVNDVLWSPQGTSILLQLGDSVQLWTTSAVCEAVFQHAYLGGLKSIAWLDDGFVGVKNDNVFKVNFSDGKLDHFVPERKLDIYKIYALPRDASSQPIQVVLCIGTFSNNPYECKLFLYDMNDRSVQSNLVIPYGYMVREVNISKDGHVGLISFVNHANPQLLHIPRRQEDILRLGRFFMPRSASHLKNPTTGILSGPNDNLVFCAGKAGDVCVWDRNSGALVHHIPSPDIAETEGTVLRRRINPTCISACVSQGTSCLVIATGNNLGLLNIWTTPLQAAATDEEAEDSVPEHSTPDSMADPSASEVSYVIPPPPPLHSGNMIHVVQKESPTKISAELPIEHVSDDAPQAPSGSSNHTSINTDPSQARSLGGVAQQSEANEEGVQTPEQEAHT